MGPPCPWAWPMVGCREGRWSVVFASSRGRRYPASAANRARSRLFQQARCGAVLHPTCRVSARLPPVVWTGIAPNSLCPTTPRPACRRAPLSKRPAPQRPARLPTVVYAGANAGAGAGADAGAGAGAGAAYSTPKQALGAKTSKAPPHRSTF
jgi:hypothetical protein